jgi:hypothetical protein
MKFNYQLTEPDILAHQLYIYPSPNLFKKEEQKEGCSSC